MKKFLIHTPKISNYITDIFMKKSPVVPLKRSMSGYEVEMTLLDDTGAVSHEAEMILKKAAKSEKKIDITKEVGRNMVEIATLPHSRIQKTASRLLDNIEAVADICEESNLSMLPLGTYPGKFQEQPWKTDRYNYQRMVFKTKRYDYFFCHSFGFHYHYALPKGTFDPKTKFLKQQIYSRTRKTMLDSYNFMIAADPVITTFAQSSPFEGGKHLAKDTRLLYQRGGKRFKYLGVFYQMQLFGALPPYKQTMSDLITSLNKKDTKFRKLMREAKVPEDFIQKKDRLDLIWNPVKINRHGTLEARGMDTNYPEINLGISVMMKYILRAIQQDFYHVIPTDIGIDEPFKLEGNVIFVPPHTHVRHEWQTISAYEGLGNKKFYETAKKFYNLAKKLTYDEYAPTLKPIKSMLDSRATVSDNILNYVKRKQDITQPLSDDLARKIALMHANKMRKDMPRVKKLYENIE